MSGSERPGQPDRVGERQQFRAQHLPGRQLQGGEQLVRRALGEGAQQPVGGVLDELPFPVTARGGGRLRVDQAARAQPFLGVRPLRPAPAPVEPDALARDPVRGGGEHQRLGRVETVVRERRDMRVAPEFP
ncbi:hypothetical protein [Streptomyces sp. NPDC088135]|uniref:hypothetical protein n=1 Tax=Streptomyces sp. NPDC088135 TaxID=3160993 RepID=UPI003412E429